VQTETVLGEKTGHYAVEMAKVIAEDEATMRERPPLSLLVCTIAPLAQDIGGMESALVFAQAGLPVGFMSMATAGSTAPATVAGTIAVADAEMVSAMVLIQMAYPGAPVYHSLMPPGARGRRRPGYEQRGAGAGRDQGCRTTRALSQPTAHPPAPAPAGVLGTCRPA
jgi:hypothetical protein